MSDNDSVATPNKRTNREGKDKGKRARSPSEEQDGVDDQPSVGEEKAVKGKRGDSGSKNSTPVKKLKTGGGGGGSSSGKSGWTVSRLLARSHLCCALTRSHLTVQPEKKKELFKTVVGHPKQADFVEVAAKLGRTPVQCHDQWRQVIYPAMLKVRVVASHSIDLQS